MTVTAWWMLPGRVLRWWWLRAGTYGPAQSRRRKACREGNGCAHGRAHERLTGAAVRATLDSGFD